MSSTITLTESPDSDGPADLEESGAMLAAAMTALYRTRLSGR